MKSLFWIASFVLVFALPLHAQTRQAHIRQLSPEAEISLITCAPGDEALYAAFGHSAVRVYDPVSKMDIAYNYGIFDFDQEGFYINFAQGYLKYKLGVYRFARFLRAYQYYERPVEEQVLNLSQAQKQAVFAYLSTNALPENQYYYYDYFDNNCATKIRDVMAEVLGEDLQFTDSYAPDPASFRDLINDYSSEMVWGNFGINLGLGSPIDAEVTPYQHQFLPDYMRDAFTAASITIEGKTQPFVKEHRMVIPGERKELQHGIWTPTMAFWLVLIIGLVLTVWLWMKGRHGRGIDWLLFGVTGLAGMVLFLLWVATDHEDTAANWNIIWAMPLHLLLVFWLSKKAPPLWVGYYALACIALLLLLLLSWYWLPQELPTAVFPLIFLLLFRLYLVWKRAYEAVHFS